MSKKELSLRALSQIDRTLNPYIPKQMDMISTMWRARGLLGKWKTDKAFFDYVKNVMNSSAAKKGGYASLGKALDHIFGKGNYKGLPLDYDKTGSSTKGDRNVTKVYWNKRKVQQTIPLHIRDRVARMEKDGTFEKAGIKPGILDRIEARKKKGETRLKKEVLRLQKLYGIKFEMGHLTAIANLGTDNPLNLFPEMKRENRSHGAREDPLDPQVQRELGWGGGHEEDLYEMILEEGGNPAVLGVSGGDWTSPDQGKMARMDADPNQVGFSRRDAILNRTLQKIEQDLAQASKDGNLLQYVDNINARITDKGYQSLAPTLKPQPKGEILEVKPQPKSEPFNIDYDSSKYQQLETPETDLSSKPNISLLDRLITPGRPTAPPGTGFNRNIGIASDISKSIATTFLTKTPLGLGAVLGSQVGTGDYIGAAGTALGAEVSWIEPNRPIPKLLNKVKQLPPGG